MKLKLLFKKTWLSFTILLIGILITITASIYTKNTLEKFSKDDFKQVCIEFKTKLITRLYSHAQLLRSGSAFFTASDSVTRADWKTFNEQSKINKNLPGIQGFGVSLIIKKEQLQQHIKNIRNQGYPNYDIFPKDDREMYTSIIYLEPFTDRNLRAFGYDMYTEPIRRKAMQEACDNDIAALSGKVVLVQETDKDLQAGTLMYVPVYRKGMPTTTKEERRAAIVGWVYSPYRMYDLMNGIVGHWDINNLNKIRLHIYDNDDISEKSLLFDSQSNNTLTYNKKNILSITIPIVFNDKKWTLKFTQTNEQSLYFHSKVIIIFIGGLIISLLLYYLSLSLINTRIRAIQIAEKLTSKLKESEVKYRGLIENSNEVIICLNEKGEFEFVNNFFSSIFEKAPDYFVGKTLWDIYPKEQADYRYESVKKVFETGLNDSIEVEVPILDKSLFFNTISSPIKDETGKVISSLTYGSDITESKQAKEALANERQRLSYILEGTNVGTWEWNIQTGETIFNERWAEIIGYQIKEISPINIETWINFTHPDDLLVSEELLKKHFKGELDYYKCEVRMKHKNGNWIWVLDRGRVHQRDNEGKPILMSGTHMDITDRKLATEKIKESEIKLREVVASKDKFFSIIAHDLRSPFNGILGFSKMLKDESRDLDIETIVRYSEILNSSAKQTFQLLENLLDWAKMQQGSFPFEPEKILLNDIIKNEIEGLKNNSDQKKIMLVEDLTVDYYVIADEKMLSNIIRNLISNSIKFTSENGKININASLKDNQVEVSVSDTGIGIKKENIEKLFKIETNITTRGTENEKGSGLGLLLCKEFVEKHEGRIWVESKVGKGSIFYFTLPYYAETKVEEVIENTIS